MIENGSTPPEADMFIDRQHPAIINLGDRVDYSVKKDETTGMRAVMMHVKEPASGQDTALAVFAGASGPAEGLLPMLKAAMDLPEGRIGTTIAIDSPRTAHNTDKKFMHDPRERVVHEDELIADRLAAVPEGQRPEHIIVNGNSAGAADAIQTAATLDDVLEQKGLQTRVEALVLENAGSLYRQSNIGFYKEAGGVPALAAETRQLLPSGLDLARSAREGVQLQRNNPEKSLAVRQNHITEELQTAISERDERMMALKEQELKRNGITGEKYEDDVREFRAVYGSLADEMDELGEKMRGPNIINPHPLTKEEQKRADDLDKRWKTLTQSLVGSVMKSGADASGKALTRAQFSKLGLDITLPKEGITKEVGPDVRARIKQPVVLVFTDDDLYFQYEAAMKAMEVARVGRMEELHAARPDLSPAEIVEEANYFPNAPAVTIVRMQGGHQESDVHPEKVARVGIEALRRTQEALQAREVEYGPVRNILESLRQRIQENFPNASDAEVDIRAKQFYAQNRAADIRASRPEIGEEEAVNRARAELVIPQLRMTLHM